MSPVTFVKWFFSWIAQMEIDPWCRYEPHMLACDGTHVVVSLRQLSLQKSITKPDCNDIPLKPVHKRLCFILCVLLKILLVL